MCGNESAQNLDTVARFNKARWEELARAGVKYGRPRLDLDQDTARTMIDRQGVLGPVAGREVLCLAAGGGQQTAAFGLLGAAVTVLDLSTVQLQRDLSTAEHYGIQVRAEQGDMRDLSRFGNESFDIVWQAHSINFVPDAVSVLSGVSRVLRAGGLYRLEFTNPFIHGEWEYTWTGNGYVMAGPYKDGEVPSEKPWTIRNDEGETKEVRGPREFRHTLGTLINGLIAKRLQLLGLWEDADGDLDAPPGTWDHFKSYGAPWITVISRKVAQRGDR